MKEDSQRIGQRMVGLARSLHRQMDAALTEAGVECASPAQGWVVHYLQEHAGEDVYQRDLECALLVRRSTVTGVLQNMERAGMIVRESVSSDARLKRLRLTDKAVAQYRFINEKMEENERRLTAGLNEEEIALLSDLLDRMSRNLQTEREKKYD